MRQSWIEVDTEAIRKNTETIAQEVAPARLCAVVKADGYGHGDVPTALAALDGGASSLAVALVEEGVRLREAGIEGPIMLLSEPPVEDVAAVIEWRLTPSVYHQQFIGRLADAARQTEQSVAVHLGVDTGMHRVGCSPDDVVQLAKQIAAAERLTLEAVWSHFAVAEEDAEFTAKQIETMQRLRASMRQAEIGVEPLFHLANTAGALGYRAGRFDMVRVGLGIYGLRPSPGYAWHVDLRPAMRVVSHVSHVHRAAAGERPSYGRIKALASASNLATVPIGYADGYSRRLGLVDARVLIRGRRYPLAGNVTMDQIVVDVGDDAVAVGDEVVVLGPQDADEISADEWAQWLGTINYEIVCHFGARLPRRYHGVDVPTEERE